MRDEVLRRRQIALGLLGASALGCGPSPSSNVPIVTIPGPTEPGEIVTVTPITSAAPSAKPVPATIDWLTSEDDARRRSKARGLPLLVFICASWAASATRMDRETWSSPRIAARSRDFIALRLDVSEADPNAQARADHFDLQTMPSTILLDELGKEIGRIEGFAGAEDVLELLDRGGITSD